MRARVCVCVCVGGGVKIREVEGAGRLTFEL